MQDVFKALGDPLRRELLDRLYKKDGQPLAELCRGLKIRRQSISQHLEILEDANLVLTLKKGREKMHYLNPAPIHEISERWLRKYETRKLQALKKFKESLEDKKS
ncbi:ArsR/SmtB family transcription factor [Leptospira wolffii]|uniref:ArsR family transcriptional regulator n=1 Tax=Leptospira wolffii TaxID=409998 RepID=A0A2M9ZCG9_9LEPT|nr:helix-turn-helix domain-containing protein [Leptospira wolffii]EPG67747.1 DNA-binding helix-turn-helix protein [Leptospira wolffii serovar Khorat str. Khorat-H2]PJZ66140.1 ArsR family transcriptional regulator [Leptospira wolffii]TGK58786.1 ArsR family transcriptional regulator [Leptospira wolffii]TGK67545.1 ArsR family transcriptional regulator [Leptospira wolffii]TGK72694.1 ArsR family transcriptional regulator [Leptospira wolffii]